MTHTTHTPAPWGADKITESQYGIRALSRTDDQHNACVAIVGQESAPYHIERENEANARLISAAPELLEALKEALKDYDDNQPIQDSEFNRVIEDSEWAARARAAINKATKGN